jgi:hypothetical protein
LSKLKEYFKNGEIYVISVMGFALWFPGLDQQVGFRLKEKYGSKHIKWTSDAVGNEVEKAYSEAVGKYAFEYNRETMRLLKERGDER